MIEAIKPKQIETAQKFIKNIVSKEQPKVVRASSILPEVPNTAITRYEYFSPTQVIEDAPNTLKPEYAGQHIDFFAF